MRRGLTGRSLPCGCLAGVYETYDGEIVGILDARSPACPDRTHRPGRTISIERMEEWESGSSTPPSLH